MQVEVIMTCGGREEKKEKKGRRMREKEEQDEAAPSLSRPSPSQFPTSRHCACRCFPMTSPQIFNANTLTLTFLCLHKGLL